MMNSTRVRHYAAFQEALKRGVFADGDDKASGGSPFMQSSVPWNRPSTAVCRTRGQGPQVHTPTHPPLCGKKRETVPDKPNQGLKQDQRFSK